VHEKWAYDTVTHVQRFMRFVGLCKLCHSVANMDRNNVTQKMVDHIMELRKWSPGQYIEYETGVFDVWRERGKIEWVIDLDFLVENGLRMNKKAVKAMGEQVERVHDEVKEEYGAAHVKRLKERGE
jgi:hypothetical protein